jgi:hypothetical protein
MNLFTYFDSKPLLDLLKSDLKAAQREFAKYPNAVAWRNQETAALAYQQAFFYMNSVTRSVEDKHSLSVRALNLNAAERANLICNRACGLAPRELLREHASFI